MFVGNESLAKFVENLKIKKVRFEICNETLDEVSACLRRGEKFEKMWNDFIYALAHINIGSYQNPFDKKMTELECVNEIVKSVQRRHFPQKVHTVDKKDTAFIKGFKQGIELAERVVALRKAVKEVCDGRKQSR